MTFQLWQNTNYMRDNNFFLQTVISLSHSFVFPYSIPFCCLNETLHSRDVLNPKISKSTQCTLMILLNLAHPEWLTIDCSSKYFIHIVCMKKNESIQNNISFEPLHNFCPDDNVMKGPSCYQFNYFNGRQMSLDAVTLQSQSEINSMREIYFILVAIKVTFPPILKVQWPFIKHTSYNKYHNVIIPTTQFLTKNLSNGYFIKKTKLIQMFDESVVLNMHKCASGTIISGVYLCDKTFDCGQNDTSDEDNCICKDTDEAKDKKCKLICSQNCKCKSSFLFNDVENNDDKSAEIQMKHTLKLFTCNNGDLINILMVDDLVPDCTGAEDEGKLKNLLRTGKMYKCPKPDQIPCREGHSRCFNVDDICVYRLNKYKHIVPCRTGEHMEECKTFECNKKFKCPDYYCIPFAYHCDGKWDCPNGVDESVTNCGKWRICKYLFHCRKSQVCIHMNDVCDYIPDCPFKDDEKQCQTAKVKCPIECLCHIYSIQCFFKMFTIDASLTLSFLYVKISQSDIESLSFANNFFKIVKLHVPQNRILDVCDILSFNDSLTHFDASGNEVTRLSSYCFHNITGLRIMNLQNNSIHEILDNAFKFLPTLNIVNLSNNLINEIESSLLKYTLLLDLVNNPLLLLSPRTFYLSKTEIIITNDYHVCCIAPTVIKCNAFKPLYI